MKKRCGNRPAFDVLGIALYRSSPETRDLVQSTFERGGRDPSAPVLAVDEEARDPPIRKGAQTLEIGAQVLDAWQLIRRPELAPACVSGKRDAQGHRCHMTGCIVAEE